MHASYPDTQTCVLWAIAWHLWVAPAAPAVCGARSTCMVFLWQAVLLSATHFLRELAFACITGSHPPCYLLRIPCLTEKKKRVIKQIDLGSTEPCFDFNCSCVKVVSEL